MTTGPTSDDTGNKIDGSADNVGDAFIDVVDPFGEALVGTQVVPLVGGEVPLVGGEVVPLVGDTVTTLEAIGIDTTVLTEAEIASLGLVLHL